MNSEHDIELLFVEEHEKASFLRRWKPFFPQRIFAIHKILLHLNKLSWFPFNPFSMCGLETRDSNKKVIKFCVIKIET